METPEVKKKAQKAPRQLKAKKKVEPLTEDQLAQAEQFLRQKGQKVEADRQRRLAECGKEIQETLDTHGCTLKINPESPLNNLQIIIAINQ